MEDKKVTAEEIKAMLAGDIDALAEEMADAMNAAQAGRIIADSEEPVREAHGRLRQHAHKKKSSASCTPSRRLFLLNPKRFATRARRR